MKERRLVKYKELYADNTIDYQIKSAMRNAKKICRNFEQKYDKRV